VVRVLGSKLIGYVPGSSLTSVNDSVPMEVSFDSHPEVKVGILFWTTRSCPGRECRASSQ